MCPKNALENNLNKSTLMILTASMKMDLIDALKLIWGPN